MKRNSLIATAIATLSLALGGGAFAAKDWNPETMILKRLEKAHGELKLNTAQDAMWQKVKKATQTSMREGRSARESIRAAAKAEMTKPEPDLRMLARQADEAVEAGQKRRREVRDQWLALYDTFTPEQKQVSTRLLREQMERLEKIGERFKERMTQEEPVS